MQEMVTAVMRTVDRVPVLTSSEAARRVGVGVERLAQLRRAGRLAAIQVESAYTHGMYVYRVEDIDALIARRTKPTLG